MKAVITVIGKDMVGILARVSGACAEMNVNVIEVTQSILDGYFCMVMIVDISKMGAEMDSLNAKLKEAVPEMVVHVMHEDIFNAMHRI
ncbi:MAG: ACT domain-containing protein [Firmicutes bacterium]|nr:ACT domain-containing protein [Bacillota bacterium]